MLFAYNAFRNWTTLCPAFGGTEPKEPVHRD
jgi:hypothetical protein